MKKKMNSKRKIMICSVIAFLILIGAIVYAAADRFLIDHVVTKVNDVTTTSDTSSTNDSNSSSSLSKTTTSPAVTDTTYESSTASIKISKVTTGSGSNQLVYFVADVTVKDGKQLLSAFADNSYGTNIIQYVSTMATDHNAILAINGDYYGFRDNGIVIRNGVIYRDSPAREGLAIYKDGSMKVYDETTTTAEELLKDGVWNTLSFGPELLDDGNIPSGIDSVEVDTNIGNHSIQGSQPRTGIGMISQNHFVFVVADGRTDNYSTGVTMSSFAKIFKDLGCTTAYNLDGGGSSEMWFNGSVINHPCNRNGSERGTSDIIYIAK